MSTALESEGAGSGNTYFHIPYLVIHPGEIESITDSPTLQQHLPGASLRVSNVEALQIGPPASMSHSTRTPASISCKAFAW